MATSSLRNWRAVAQKYQYSAEIEENCEAWFKSARQLFQTKRRKSRGHHEGEASASVGQIEKWVPGSCKDGLIQRILDFTPEADAPQPRKMRVQIAANMKYINRGADLSETA